MFLLLLLVATFLSFSATTSGNGVLYRLNPQPLPPGFQAYLNPQPLPPGFHVNVDQPQPTADSTCCASPYLNYNSKTYVFVSCPLKTPSNARSDCVRRLGFGANLLSIDSLDEKDFIHFALQSWYGGQTYAWWIRNDENSGVCSILYDNYEWRSEDCGHSHRYICEASVYQQPRPAIFSINPRSVVG